jgi:hypothetical protein
MLITRKLLILRNATTAKKALLPDPLYVYCTKMLCSRVRIHHIVAAVSHRFAVLDRGSTLLCRHKLFFGLKFEIVESTPCRTQSTQSSSVRRDPR